MLISKTLSELLLDFRVVSSTQEALNICEMGLVRLNGSVCTNGFYIPQAGDQVSTLRTDYTYLVPGSTEIL